MADADRLLALAEAISDGLPIEWQDTEASTEDHDERALVHHLRLVAGVASVHRGQQPDNATDQTPRTWGALTVVERVGSGSFGAVYKARDARLAREVALKLLHRDADNERASLLIAEGRRLARIRHPHVISVYGADWIDGRAGIWMELIEGRTLEHILRTDGPFGPREAALIGIDLCGALAAVHSQGMIHRDVKAQNVMREEGGRVVLMDFGAGQDASAHAEPHAVGTPAYMAPEVLRGGGATTQSDIYSLGVLLFRLVTAQYPVPGPTVTSLLPAHEEGRRLRLSDARPDLPAAFVTVIERALAPQPADRFDSAGAMQMALAAYVVPERPDVPPSGRRWPRRAIGVAAIAVAAVAFGAWPWWRDAAPPSSGVRAIAVRPLRNLDSDPAQQYFAAGLTDVLLAQLGSTPGLRVTALAAETADASTLSRVAPEGILDGSVQRGSGRVRVSVRLVQAGTGTVLWGKVYEGREAEAFALQAQMATDLARDLHAPSSGSESRRAGRTYIVQPSAQESYLRGRYLLDTLTRQNLIAARTEFERALQIEPEYAPALASLAMTYLALGNIGVLAPAEVMRLAPPAAASAQTLDPTLADAALAVADVRFRLYWDWAGAEKAYRDTIALNPSHVEARGQYARLLAAAGRTADAMREAQDAYQIDPLSADIHSVVGMMLYYDRRFDEAVTHFSARVDEPSARSSLGVGRAASAAGRHGQAIAALQRALELSGGDPSIEAELARAIAASGDGERATRMLHDLEARRQAGSEYIAPQDLAYIDIALGRPDEAFALLDQAVEEHASRLLFLAVDPRVDAIRSDPRFDPLVARTRRPATTERN